MKRATIRTYRHGLGDCHLITLHGRNKTAYRILIDCGVILGTANASAVMTEVIDDVVKESKGKVDLLVATHQHWDHVSGFAQAADAFARLKVGSVWMAWTEDPTDADGKALAQSKGKALASLQQAALHLENNAAVGNPLFVSLAEFFGTAGAITTQSALEAVRNKAKPKKPRYCDPADPPMELKEFHARIYVLGPPRDLALLKRVDPSKKAVDETFLAAVDSFGAAVAPALQGGDEGAPFGAASGMRLADANAHPFFAERYFEGPEWRRIDSDWMLGADALALALDNMTNNTSLVLAIELGGEDVLLFAADAQVGNWLSWGDCTWKVGKKTVTGADLLARTIYYKVGHHGSVNATLKEKGLAQMTRLQTAVIPVDHDMAVKKGWGALPLDPLVKALEKATAGRGYLLRSDRDVPAAAAKAGVRSTDAFIEVTL